MTFVKNLKPFVPVLYSSHWISIWPESFREWLWMGFFCFCCSSMSTRNVMYISLISTVFRLNFIWDILPRQICNAIKFNFQIIQAFCRTLLRPLMLPYLYWNAKPWSYTLRNTRSVVLSVTLSSFLLTLCTFHLEEEPWYFRHTSMLVILIHAETVQIIYPYKKGVGVTFYVIISHEDCSDILKMFAELFMMKCYVHEYIN